jgi:hypothetical protein
MGRARQTCVLLSLLLVAQASCRRFPSFPILLSRVLQPIEDRSRHRHSPREGHTAGMASFRDTRDDSPRGYSEAPRQGRIVPHPTSPGFAQPNAYAAPSSQAATQGILSPWRLGRPVPPSATQRRNDDFAWKEHQSSVADRWEPTAAAVSSSAAYGRDGRGYDAQYEPWLHDDSTVDGAAGVVETPPSSPQRHQFQPPLTSSPKSARPRRFEDARRHTSMARSGANPNILG